MALRLQVHSKKILHMHTDKPVRDGLSPVKGIWWTSRILNLSGTKRILNHVSTVQNTMVTQNTSMELILNKTH